jgi:hypothetical protein
MIPTKLVENIIAVILSFMFTFVAIGMGGAILFRNDDVAGFWVMVGVAMLPAINGTIILWGMDE